MTKWRWIKWTIGDIFSSLFALSKMLKANKKEYDNISEEIISYGKHEDQHLLLFEPTEGKVKNNFIFFLHGGGWKANNPSKFRFVGNYFAQKGYVTISAGYRYVPDFTYPTQIKDAFIGFNKAYNIVDNRYSEDKGAIIVGSSSGAHLGSIVAYDKNRQVEYEINPDRIKGFVSHAGPLNFKFCGNPTITKLINDFMGGSKDIKNASPMEIIKSYKKIPKVPVLCIHGDKDPAAEYENSKTFVDYINEKNEDHMAEIFKAKGMYHSDLSVYLFLEEIEAQKKLMAWLEKNESV